MSYGNESNTIRTEQNKRNILAAIARGASFAIAFGAAGISSAAFYEWKRDDGEFRDDIKKARNACALERLDKITLSDQWQAHAWWLERQFPEDFTLVQKIEQVLAKHGLISAGIAAQLEDGGEEPSSDALKDTAGA